MPALPDAVGASPAPSSGDMPALPDAVGGAALAPAATVPASAASVPAASSDVPALPDAGSAAASPAATPTAVAPVVSAIKKKKPKPEAEPEKQSWKESKERPSAIFGGWVKAKGGNITSKLSWVSQQVLNAMDAHKYKMANETGVYEGEQNKGPQYRKYNFTVPHSKDVVIVLLKQTGNKIWLRVGPDEEPAPANHTYAEVAKIREEGLTVLHIIKAKLGARMAPHRMVPSWDAQFDRQRETADE
jgi:hypothetical protein